MCKRKCEAGFGGRGVVCCNNLFVSWKINIIQKEFKNLSLTIKSILGWTDIWELSDMSG